MGWLGVAAVVFLVADAAFIVDSGLHGGVHALGAAITWVTAAAFALDLLVRLAGANERQTRRAGVASSLQA